MRLFQRYILFELVRVFGFVLSVLTVLLVFVGVAREVSENGLGPIETLQILPYVVPSLLPFTIPATLLLTVCVVYGRIAGDQEVTAAKAAGINVLSLLAPSFCLGAALSICSLVMTDQVFPWAVGNIERIVTSAMEDIFLDVLRTKKTISRPDYGFAITVLDIEDRTLIKPIFQYAPRGKEPVHIKADEATIEFDLERHEVKLHLIRGRASAPGKDSAYFHHHTARFKMPAEVIRNKETPRQLSVARIRSRLEKMKEVKKRVNERRNVETAWALALGDFDHLTSQPYLLIDAQMKADQKSAAKLKTEVHSRFAMSSSCFFFVLLGGPFSISQARRQFLTSFFICFVPILLVYYPVLFLTINLSKMGTIDPAWSMWVANTILFVASISILRKVMRH